MLALLRRRPLFLRLYLAGGISLVGDWMTLVAVSTLSLGEHGGPLTLAMVYAAHALPQALCGTIAGPIADRFDRRRVLLVAQLVQALMTVLMAFAAFRGAIGALSLLVLVRSAVSSLLVPAEAGALRRVVDRTELLDANALLAATWSLTFVLGMALGGALAAIGPVFAISLDAATFVIAAALLATLPPMPIDRSEAPLSGLGAVGALLTDMSRAFRHALGDARLFCAMMSKAPLSIGAGAAWIALNICTASAHPFGSAALSIGVLQAVKGAGTGIGPLLAKRMMANGWSTKTLATGAAVMALTSMACFTALHDPLLLVLCALFWGIGAGTNWVISTVELQRGAEDAMVGRLSAWDDLIATGTMVVSACAGATLVDMGASMTGIVVAFSLLGAGCWWWLTKRTPNVEALEVSVPAVL